MIRKAAVAGMFYPADPGKLNDDIDKMLTEATQVAAAQREAEVAAGSASELQRFPDRVLRAVIVPHAGYVYSGLTAATAYALIGAVQKEGQHFDRVVVVGPTHRVAVYGCAYPTATAFATPLGTVPVWNGIVDALAGVTGVAANDETHQDEHAIEVQLPFLQKVLPDVPFVPINAGQIRQEVLADVVERLLDAETLLVISSDLSHYLPYDVANELDALTLGQILTLEGPLQHEQACGATPVNGVIELARRNGWYPVLLAACNSGDTAGDKDRVVGYCAIAFFEKVESELDDDLDFDAPMAEALSPAVERPTPAVEQSRDLSREVETKGANPPNPEQEQLYEQPTLSPSPQASAPDADPGSDSVLRLAEEPQEQSVLADPAPAVEESSPAVEQPSPTVEDPSPAVERSRDQSREVETIGVETIPAAVGPVMLAQARHAIESQLGFIYDPPEPWGDWAEMKAGTFVTLTKDGELRGCIGSLVDRRPLSESVPANALNAAFKDPRFNPLTPQEWPEIDIEVSVLTEPSPILVDDGADGFRPPATEAEALAALQPGVDGVIFVAGGRQSTFLPQVWDQLPEKQEFLDHLRAKAGLPANYWGDDVELYRYHVTAFEEE